MLDRTSKIAEIYRDFNLALPAAAGLWIEWTWWIGEKAFYLPLLLPPLLGGLLLPLADQLLLRDPARSIRAMLAMLIMVLVIVALIMLQDVLLGSPMMGLLSGMTGVGGKR